MDLHSGVVEASQGPGGALREADGLPPPPSLLPTLLTASSRCVPAVLSAAEEGGSLTAESALAAAALCSPGCGWSTSGESAAPGEEGGLPGKLLLSGSPPPSAQTSACP